MPPPLNNNPDLRRRNFNPNFHSAPGWGGRKSNFGEFWGDFGGANLELLAYLDKD